MRSFVWTSDLHLDRLSHSDFSEFKNWLLEQQSDALVLSGDIAEADSFAGYLRDLARILPGPIYFVLGNHDFWGSSFSDVHAAAGRLVRECSNVHWLSA